MLGHSFVRAVLAVLQLAMSALSPLLPPLPPPFLAALGVLLGSVMGSYLATVLWRMPRGGSANHGRSECDYCATPLPWPVIVPLFGLVFSRGRCSHCGARITRQHLALEIACAVVGGWFFCLGEPLLAPLLWLLIVLAMFDAFYLWLPNKLVAATACAALVAPPPEAVSWMDRFVGGMAGFGALWLVATVYRTSRGRVGLGGGDIKLFGAIGLWCGFAHLPIILLGACILGIFHYLALTATNRANADSQLPLGTYLASWTAAFAFGTSADGMSIFGYLNNYVP